jgi:superfamily II helicase
MELAILRLLSQGEKGGKIIYMAPTKALSSQRASDWEQRFACLGLSCIALKILMAIVYVRLITLFIVGRELTGNTDYVTFDHIRNCNIM